MPVRFGAIYWSGWSGQSRSNSQWYTNNQMSPSQNQTRAPWFSQQLSAHTLYINKTQAQMDQDCIYASDGGIKYWVFGWYGNAGEPGHGTNSLASEYKLYDASPNKNLVKWCFNIGMQKFKDYVNTDLAKLIGYVQQVNYEKVFANRPLIYFGHVESIASSEGVAEAVAGFRAACSSNGVGDPYFVVMNFDGPTAKAAMTEVGAQAITTYARAYGGVSRQSFANYIADQQSQWNNHWKPTGAQLVPNVTSGWNVSPIRSRGTPGDSYNRGGIEANMYDHVVPATPAELVTLATACKTFMADNAAQCTANTALWYAWNEHSEGGYLSPLWSASGPNKTRLDALASVHNT